MKIKEWFESGTGLTIDKVKSSVNPSFPYHIYTDDLLYRGVNTKINLIEHEVTIKRYDHEINETSEKIIIDFLKEENISFQQNCEWDKEESCFITTFKLETQIEKIHEEIE